MDYKGFLQNFIAAGLFNYEELVYKIDKLYIEGKLSESDRDELVNLAAERASDAAQGSLFSIVVDLQHRVFALETGDIAEWVAGYTTKKGEVVKFDYDNDGKLDLLRYDGGRDYTALSPGKIDGWHVVDSLGNILGTYYKGEFIPV